ncbi:MAG: hypothetical protein ACI8S6_003626, partial [Myxococcota bacterium]
MFTLLTILAATGHAADDAALYRVCVES